MSSLQKEFYANLGRQLHRKLQRTEFHYYRAYDGTEPCG